MGVLWMVVTGRWDVNAAESGLATRPINLTCVAPDRPPGTFSVTSKRIFKNITFAQPISMSQPPGDPSRWVIAERLGTFYSFANISSVTTKQVVLDITDRIQFTATDLSDSQQWGITSFAFHPGFPASPYIFVGYNARPAPGEPVMSVVSRFESTDAGLTFDEASEQTVVSVEQSTPFHHVGKVAFGLDGYLYIGFGDGGCPTCARSQDLNDLRGSILRIDIDSGSPYSIPQDNPLVGTGNREEIYAWGVRNPWRFTIDRGTGDLWFGDVGHSDWEEISRVESGGNFGWPILEGTHCVNPGCDSSGLIPPVVEYNHSVGTAVTGGYVYRGNAIESLQGTYVFGDAVTRKIWAITYDAGGNPVQEELLEPLITAHSFSEALDGEIYMFDTWTNQIYKLVPLENGPGGSNPFPNLLSETGCFDPADPTQPDSGLIPYDVNTRLWSDGAEKDRWLALPDGTTIGLMPDGDFDFPIGTVLIKQFSFDGVPFETRLLTRHDDGGWAGYSYEWLDDLSDAVVLEEGKTKQVTDEVLWTYPSRDQCMQCHTDAAGFVLGPEVIQLNRDLVYPSTGIEANQLTTLDYIGMFTAGLSDDASNLQALAPITTGWEPVARRARSYLHANCSGCHRPDGPAQSTADFRFSTKLEDMNICNVAPGQGDMGVPGAQMLAPGDPSSSVISLRMHTLTSDRMPPLGTAIVDAAGVGVIDTWIAGANVCQFFTDSDDDGIDDDWEQDNFGNLITATATSDNDMDGFSDLVEFLSSTDPLEIASFPILPDGDINGDGKVDVADFMLAHQIIGGNLTPTPDQEFQADVGPFAGGLQLPDGKLDLGDLLLIQQKAVDLRNF
jgi:uncharacterized repeat protein (TIGR03806 family)